MKSCLLPNIIMKHLKLFKRGWSYQTSFSSEPARCTKHYNDLVLIIVMLYTIYLPERTINYLMERIEKVQYEAASAIAGAWHGYTRMRLYEALVWETLSDCRWHQRIIQIYKIQKNMT